MKRYAKYLIGPAVIAVVAVLVMVNRNSVQEDIDRASAKQFPVVLDGVEQIYEYSEEDPAYVEFDAQMRKKNGDVYEVTVGYVAPGASWTTTEDGDSYTPTPDKYMIYRMKKEDGEYYIVGIKDPGEAPVDTTTPPDVVPGLSSSEAA